MGFCNAVKANVQRNGGMPPVTAVTFGAPRVGDRNFAAKFGAPRCPSPAAACGLALLMQDRLIFVHGEWAKDLSAWSRACMLDLANLAICHVSTCANPPLRFSLTFVFVPWCSRMTPPLAPDAVFLNLPVVTDRLTSALSSASWWATSRGLDLENHLLFFAWSYATFMAAWLISEQALPNVAFWSPAWTPITTNVSARMAILTA